MGAFASPRDRSDTGRHSAARSIDAAADLCEDGPHLTKPYNPQMVVIANGPWQHEEGAKKEKPVACSSSCCCDRKVHARRPTYLSLSVIQSANVERCSLTA
jgi:hypothetical protein